MKSVIGFIEQLIVLVGLFILVIYWFFRSSSSYFIPPIFFIVATIIIGIFEFRGYQSVTLYRLSIFVILAVMWVTIYIQSIPLITDNLLYYIESALLTLALILLAVYYLVLKK